MLNETCLLVSLSIKLPPQTKIAKSASEDVERQYHTAKRQSRVTKSLFSQKDIKPLTNLQSRARIAFNEASLPYDSAYRIIPSETYFEFCDKMRAISTEFDTERVNFLRKYDEIRERARESLGSLFSPTDYPPVGVLEDKIKLTIESSVIPPVTAFDNLAGLTPEAAEELKQQAVNGQQERIETALHDLFKRLFDSLHKAVVKLSSEDSVFRDTLIGNILEAVSAVRKLNLTDDSRLNDLAEDIKEVVGKVSPDQLRNDKELRKDTAEEMKRIVESMDEFF